MRSRQKALRLYLVGIVFVIVTVALWARLIQVQHFRHEHYSRVAVHQRVISEEIEPIRGGVFDRHGNPLALSVRHYSVAVCPAEVTHPDKVVGALARALNMPARKVRSKLRSKKQFVWVDRQVMLDAASRKELKSLRGVVVDREAGRVYPYGDVGAKLVGFVGYDGDGMAGVEAAYDRDLRGTPGVERVLRNGRYKTDRYYRFTEKKPIHGRHLFLTIDIVVQEIAEAEIQRAVKEASARSGAIIVMDIDTGELLALAEYPSPRRGVRSGRADSLWTIRSVSHVYEPGSTFKLVTAAALFESRAVTTADTFDAEEGSADLGFAFIKDPHPHGILSFADAFAYSSNIVMAKASTVLEARDFYERIRLFGFGAKTGIGLLGESPGFITDVDDWSARTQGTLAFGQEIAVTPLQLIGAYAAIANGGELMMPRLVTGVADESAGSVRRLDPVKVRSVVSKDTAALLKDLCRRVVSDGTGSAAALDFMAVAGKTGTGQKARPRGGYIPGKYVSSFVGFAPYDKPEIVCLVVIDEPRYEMRYGGDSAAPAFARVCRGLVHGSGVFESALAVEHVDFDVEADRHDYNAPNFMRMDRVAALDFARRIGANVLCTGDAGRVIAQEPSPGTTMDRDDVIRLTVSDLGSTDGRRATPDLVGLSVREAKKVAARHGFKCSLVGGGKVRRQSPPPGRETAYHTVKLYCEAGGGVSGSSH